MPSSYTPLLRLTLPSDGELVGTWGQTVNNGITSLEEAAIAGTATIGLVDADFVLSVANGAPDSARNAVIRLTGAITAVRNIICPSSSKTYIVRNNTTGGYNIVFKTAAGTGIAVPPGMARFLYCDGVNVVDASTGAGTQYFNDGTAALPSITFAGSNTTGIFRVPGEALGFSTSGTEKMRIDAAGNVGIGTTNPNVIGSFTNLVINHTGAQSPILIFSRSGTTTGQIAGQASIFSIDSTGNPLGLFTAGQKRMHIDTAGNVGVGVTPSAWASTLRAMEVNGAAVAGSADGLVGYFATNLYADAGNWRAKVAGAGTLLSSTSGEFTWFGTASVAAGAPVTLLDRMRIDATGNVGIGNVPGAMGDRRLGVQSVSATDGVAAVFCNNGSTGAGIQLLQNGVDTFTLSMPPGGGGLRFIQGGSAERMLIGGTGIVFIGTNTDFGTSTAGQLKIAINSSGSNPLLVRNLNGSAYWQIGPRANDFQIYNNSDVGVQLVNGATAWTASSDESLKTDTAPLRDATEKLATLRALTGRFINDEAQGYTKRRVFLIAQDVQTVLPEAVHVMEDGTLGLAYTDVIPLLVAAIKELHLRIAALGG